MYQKIRELVKYVETGNRSHKSPERKFWKMWFAFGNGNMNHAYQNRPTWMPGYTPAQMTAKIVIASEKRLIEVRHFCRNRNRMALMSVPAWPIPIQKTKLVMSNAHATGTLLPHTPTPVEIRYVAASTPPVKSDA